MKDAWLLSFRGCRMSSESQTGPILLLTPVELDWLYHALANVQTRGQAEHKARGEVAAKVWDRRFLDQPRFAISFTPLQMDVLLHAVNEGRCRPGEQEIKDKLRVEIIESSNI